MSRSNFKYWIDKNKIKIATIVGILLIVLVIIGGFFLANKRNSYNDSFDEVDSKRYVLSSGIIGASQTGAINLYSSSDGRILDSLKFEGDFIFDMSDDFKVLHMINILNNELISININENKLNSSKKELLIPNNEIASLFDCDNDTVVILNSDTNSFLIKPSGSNNFRILKTNILENIDTFRIVNQYLIYTSSEYIYSTPINESLLSTDIKETLSNMKIYDKENINGNIIAETIVGEKIIILENNENWYKVVYNNNEGYIPTSLMKFKEYDKEDKYITKIHIGEVSSFIHEIGDNTIIHNGFGKERGKSILLDIKPDNLYIKNLVKYENPTNSLVSSIADTRIYVNEIFSSNTEDIRQIIRYRDTENNFEDMLGFKYTSKNILDSDLAFGMLGYVYYKDNGNFNIYNLKSQQNDLSIKLNDKFLYPIY